MIQCGIAREFIDRLTSLLIECAAFSTTQGAQLKFLVLTIY